MQRQDELPKFAAAEGSDIQQFMNPPDAAKSILERTDTAMRRPDETSRWFSQTADGILAEVAQARRAAESRESTELRSTVTDLQILAGLARYYSWRLRAAVYYNLYRESGDLASFDHAITHEQHAIEAWRGIVEAAGNVYSDSLAFGVHRVGFSRHWKEELQLLERDFERLTAERKKISPRPGVRPVTIPVRATDAQPAAARLEPIDEARPGRDLTVSAKVTSAAGIKRVRLRYRHLTQFEDYETAEMTLDSKTGLYTARIPGSFIAPQWDLMYFIEVVDTQGAGRMFPDLEVQMPYVVVPVKR
jgi:hypothetical protein